MTMTILEAIASNLRTYHFSDFEQNRAHAEDRIEAWVKAHMPSGSGFDNGTELDFDASSNERLVFKTAFHHMDDHGFYCGWTHHKVIVKPSLIGGFELRVTGVNKRGIKEYIADSFRYVLYSVKI